MCLTHPVKISAVKNGLAKVYGKNLEVKTALIPDAKEGDWVLVNANLAIKKISPGEAEETKNLLN